MRILVAEDDRPVASFLSKSLEAEQYAVDVATDGEEANYMAENYEYDLVILDINLPKKNRLRSPTGRPPEETKHSDFGADRQQPDSRPREGS